MRQCEQTLRTYIAQASLVGLLSQRAMAGTTGYQLLRSISINTKTSMGSWTLRTLGNTGSQSKFVGMLVQTSHISPTLVQFPAMLLVSLWLCLWLANILFVGTAVTFFVWPSEHAQHSGDWLFADFYCTKRLDVLFLMLNEHLSFVCQIYNLQVVARWWIIMLWWRLYEHQFLSVWVFQ